MQCQVQPTAELLWYFYQTLEWANGIQKTACIWHQQHKLSVPRDDLMASFRLKLVYCMQEKIRKKIKIKNLYFSILNIHLKQSFHGEELE